MTRPEGDRSAALPLVLWSLLLLLVTADVVLGGPLRSADHALADRSSGPVRGPLEFVLVVLTEFGSPVRLPILAASYAGYLAVRHRTLRPPARLAVGCVLAAVLVTIAKIAFGRMMPTHDALWTEAGRSYPSGHTVTAVVVWGIVAWIATDYGAPAPLRALTGVLRWLGPLVTAAAMVLLGFHWLTDVLAGAALGVLLVAAARKVDRATLKDWPGADRGIAGSRRDDRRGVDVVRGGAGRGGRPGAVHDPRSPDP